ncbi:restriction endonuclease subunit S [Staphylococcus debuckii]|uniref:restriction endonuclease subunit S n=1 Tax=Staphylococcus debuckii TaxID=2044912 RepID=UPI000F434E5D|nr:restriction endonuclease subunit S [Staphylococcus debuckii]AYU55820.1 restriction endonuclease subunit S [Staphylococcus debuckii]
MSDWKTIKLKDFVTLKRGYDLPHDKSREGNYPVIASTNIRGYHDEYKVDSPVVTVGRSGSIGKVQVVNKKAWPLNTTLYVKDSKGNDINFIYYFLQTMGLEQFNSGAGVPTLNRNHIGLLKIIIPNIKKQEKIAKILSTYDKLIENNNRRIEVLEQTAEEIYKEWFVRMRFPGSENIKFDKGIPEGWENVKLGEIISRLESGSRPKSVTSEEVMIVSLGAGDVKGLGEYINTNEYLIPYSFYKKMTRGKVRSKDIAVYKDGAYTGKVTMFRDDFPYKETAINEHVFLVSSKESILQNYLLFTLKQKSYFDLMQALSMTSAQPGLNQRNFKNIKIILPLIDILEKFNNLIEDILKEIFNLSKQNQNLSKQRDLLLPRLMNGTIEVK